MLGGSRKTSVRAAEAALKERFDPGSRRELHIVEFQTACGGCHGWRCRGRPRHPQHSYSYWWKAWRPKNTTHWRNHAHAIVVQEENRSEENTEEDGVKDKSRRRWTMDVARS